MALRFFSNLELYWSFIVLHCHYIAAFQINRKKKSNLLDVSSVDSIITVTWPSSWCAVELFQQPTDSPRLFHVHTLYIETPPHLPPLVCFIQVPAGMLLGLQPLSTHQNKSQIFLPFTHTLRQISTLPPSVLVVSAVKWHRPPQMPLICTIIVYD